MTSKADKSNTMIIAGVALFILLIGGYLYYKQQNTSSFSVSIGDHEISGTIQE